MIKIKLNDIIFLPKIFKNIPEPVETHNLLSSVKYKDRCYKSIKIFKLPELLADYLILPLIMLIVIIYIFI